MAEPKPDPKQVLAEIETAWQKALEPSASAVSGEPSDGAAPPPTDWNQVRAAAIDLLATFVDPARQADRQVVAIDLVPTREDLEAIFQPEQVDAVEAAYRAAFRSPPMPVARADQTRIILATARPDQLAERSPISDQFPGAYRRLLDRLMPEPVWAAWKFVAPGSAHGMLYDGLVWTGRRWVWIPKPWRLFPDLA